MLLRFQCLEKLGRAAWTLLALLLLCAPTLACARLASPANDSFLCGPDRSGTVAGVGDPGIGGLLATRQGGVIMHALSDLRGNVAGLVDGSGVPTFNPRYGAFGPLSAPTLNAPSFATRWRDPTGFYYFGGRYYDAATGRFLSPDPSRFADSRNLYAYCGNDPVNNCDPDGMLEKQLQQPQQSSWDIALTQMQQFNADYQRMSDAKRTGDSYTYDRLNAQLSGQISDSISSALTPFTATATAFSPIHAFAHGLTDLIEGGQSGNARTMGFGVLGMASALPGGGELRAFRSLGAESRFAAAAKNLAGTERLALTAEHHIVAQGSAKAAEARQILAELGVDVQAEANKVFLPYSKLSAEPGMLHTTLHTDVYYNEVNAVIRSVTSQEDALSVLNSFRSDLLNGTFPR